MRTVIGLLRIIYVQILRTLSAMFPAASIRRFVELECVRQCCLASQAGTGLDDAALEELLRLHPQYINLPVELNRLAASNAPERHGADLLAHQLRIEAH